MIAQQEAQRILQLLQSTDGMNRLLGQKLMYSQQAYTQVVQAMSSQIEEDFYPNNPQTEVLYHFTGKLITENQKGILTQVEKQLLSEKLLTKHPQVKEYVTRMSFRRKLFSALAEVVNMRQGITFAQLATHREEDLLQIVRLLVTISPVQCTIYFKSEGSRTSIERMIAEFAYLNTTLRDPRQLKQLFKDAIKRNNRVSNEQPYSLTYIDLLRKVRQPLQLRLLPTQEIDKTGYVLKVAIALPANS